MHSILVSFCVEMALFWPTCEKVSHVCWFGYSDLRCDKWASKKHAEYLDESAHFQDLREEDNSASEVTYGEVEQRLSQLQEHLNRYKFFGVGKVKIFSFTAINYEFHQNTDFTRLYFCATLCLFKILNVFFFLLNMFHIHVSFIKSMF